MKINILKHQGFGCKICSDGNSYPNKFVNYILHSLGVDFHTEKKFEWSSNKRYDIYSKKKSLIIENHGIQHYNGGFVSVGGRTVEEEEANDKLKHELALSNGIKHYIELDCRKSELEWIKNSVMNSDLPNILNFKEEDIDWIECNSIAHLNIFKCVCVMNLI